MAQETIGLDLTHSDDTLSITLVPKTVTDEWFAASYEIRNDSDRSVWVVSQDHPHVVANLADGSHVLALAFVTAPEQAGTYMPAAHAVTELPPGQSMDSTVSMPRPFVIEPGVERGKQSVVDMDSVRLCVAHIDQDIVPEGLPKSGLLPGDVLAVPDAVGLELQRISCSTPVSLS
ncbi:hypothetical protein [Schaalia suimastitidis]|uniref:hypothetical protein n=1 Tax=Schaalia suimastitidis TaxID=121163 RepID=UPI0003FADA48|nr:hypothetical protein [Schaalia suimastitidis]